MNEFGTGVPMLDAETQRELVMLKAKALGIEDADIAALDAVLCAVLGILDPDPLILDA
jgi:hypothetical protein